MGIERLTTLAFSMYTNKGAYALLLGSGISRPAHIPSGWDVEERLIRDLGVTKGICEHEDWHKWYRETFGEAANYSDLLGKLARTPTERVELMRKFFEPTEEDQALGWKEPTRAHRAIAELAKGGYIKVIITTNFDRLLEQALEREGVIPQVICHESEIAKATPIVHSKTVTILKINGDYADCRFRNTAEELDSYPKEWVKYLIRVFEDFGLLTCGWSAKWDEGLVKIISNAQRSRYSSFFAVMGSPEPNILGLVDKKKGEIVSIEGADKFFTELNEQIAAVEKSNANRNLTHEMLVARVKKYLPNELYDIDYADLVERMGEEAFEKITAEAHYGFEPTPEIFRHYLDLHHNAVNDLIEVAILTARWGKPRHFRILGGVLVKLCIKEYGDCESFVSNAQHLHGLAATLLFNAIGIACVKYSNFNSLNETVELNVPGGNFIDLKRKPLLYLIGQSHWDAVTLRRLMKNKYIYPESHLALDMLKSHFEQYFVADSEYEECFYIWEHLKSLIYGFNMCYGFPPFRVPVGGFLLRMPEHNQSWHGESLYGQFFEDADRLKDEWPPIIQGMFGGKYENYKSISEQAEEYYKQVGRYY